MKYLKYYENNNGVYWLVDTKYIEIAIDKLKLSEEQKKYLLNNKLITGKEKHIDTETGTEYFVDSIYLPICKDCIMSWMPGNNFNDHLNQVYQDFFKINKQLKYMGKLEITADEISDFESKKYNL